MIGKCQILQVPQAQEQTWKAVSDTVLETISPVLITKVVTRWGQGISAINPGAINPESCSQLGAYVRFKRESVGGGHPSLTRKTMSARVMAGE